MGVRDQGCLGIPKIYRVSATESVDQLKVIARQLRQAREMRNEEFADTEEIFLGQTEYPKYFTVASGHTHRLWLWNARESLRLHGFSLWSEAHVQQCDIDWKRTPLPDRGQRFMKI